jgi:Holliday junction resolvasome RuvABC DNA-binding subunit
MSTQVKRTKKYKALIALGLSETEALKKLKELAGETEPAPTKSDIQELLDAGFSEEDARRIVGDVVTSPKSAKELIAEAVRDAGYQFTNGRVYMNSDVVQGIVRVMKTGTTEIVPTSGVGRVKAVVLIREESGDVSVQNLSLA